MADPYTLLPDLYHTTRFSRSDEIIDDLLTPLGPEQQRVLEIGAGTGRLTEQLLKRGLHVTALEPSPTMRGKLLSLLGSHPNLTVLPTTFEDADLDGTWPMVVADSAWPLLDPNIRLPKARSLLRSGGALGTLTLRQVAAEPNFFSDPERAAIYQQHEHPDVVFLEPRQRPPDEYAEFAADPALNASLRYYDEVHRYPADLWADCLRTYTGTYCMPPERQAAFLGDLVTLINERYDGVVERPVEISLVLAINR